MPITSLIVGSHFRPPAKQLLAAAPAEMAAVRAYGQALDSHELHAAAMPVAVDTAMGAGANGHPDGAGSGESREALQLAEHSLAQFSPNAAREGLIELARSLTSSPPERGRAAG